MQAEVSHEKNNEKILFTLGGLIVGYSYYLLVGCANGACAISGNPINASLYGALIGFLLSIVFEPSEKTKKNTDDVGTNKQN